MPRIIDIKLYDIVIKLKIIMNYSSILYLGTNYYIPSLN